MYIFAAATPLVGIKNILGGERLGPIKDTIPIHADVYRGPVYAVPATVI